MNGEIIIKSLECFGFHGVLGEEKKLGQKFIVSAKLKVDFTKAVDADACENTVNYSEVCQLISNVVKDTNFNLIESLADRITKEILLGFPLVESVYVKVEKPWAPIKLCLDTVAVAVEKKWHTVYLGVGSNIGDSEANIESAVRMIKESEYNKDVTISNLIKTKPYGYKEQDDFLNGAISLKTFMEPNELLCFLQKIEEELKRIRKIHWGPRTIDLDVLLYDDLVTVEQNLVIPHPDMCNRDFVLKPLCELNPYLVHPLNKKRFVEIYNELQLEKEYERTL
ncbi:MAG: 2-amino-4-hydroxy-6-hydroxymethyldihydropteridine diphosphokinase [Lachnospiraceae bacterium]|nr:2-amino-4-hydroxy-6-hydroxymethyldihydropteridine diphosphokinase [Lachnospiraceae bacterium]MBQ6995719.1 2-amino-4-hydroxy-6-hydroxymethyldihydropteridine diphosphokinase [Lachnospiraceae bacterium]